MKFRINKTKYSIRQIVSWLWKHHGGCRVQAFTNMAVGLLLVVIGLVCVEVVKRLTDVAVGSADGNLWLLAGVLASMYILELILHVVQTWVGALLGVKSQNKFQQMFFNRLLKGRWSGVEKFHSGDVLNRLFGDVKDIVGLLTDVLPFLVVIVFQFVLSFVYLFSLAPKLALILVIVCPVLLLLSRFYVMKMRRYVRKTKDSNSAIQAIIQECVQHKMVIKVLEQADAMVCKLDCRQSLLRHQVRSKAKFSIVVKTIVTLGFSGSYLAALTLGVFQLKDGLISVGVLVAFTQLIGRIQRPLLDMARLFPSLVNSLTSAERLMELEELPMETIPERSSSELDSEKKLGVRFEHVDFNYDNAGRECGKRLVLKDFSYAFEPGSFTAVLGPTGIGKTTLLRLMLALVDSQNGNISLYGDSGRSEMVNPGIRKLFSYVPQGNTLFSGTIRENLLFGNFDASDAEIQKALELAKADFVFDKPDGLFTLCGEQGGGLSEGQAQRIAIARAILRPCKILLLDEATSALDIQTEKEILTNIKNYYSDTTVIFVTHRLSAVSFATNELVLG